jgi:hypothetical protein
MAMDITIKNGGKGPDIGAHVDQNNQLHTVSIVESATQDATSKGNAYNINTGWIALTSTTASGVFYFFNGESPVNGESSFIIDTIVVSVDAVGTTAAGDPTDIVIIANPTGGTLISGAVAVDYKHNKNFGSSNTLSSTTLVYKGAEGNTVTGGSNFDLISQNVGSRQSYPVDIEIPKGSSIAITMDTQTTGGSTSVYVAIIGHRKDASNS